jgi:hypothetical protein
VKTACIGPFRFGAAIQYGSFLSHQAIQDGPQWVPTSAVPLDFSKAEEIARRQLRKLVKDDSL